MNQIPKGCSGPCDQGRKECTTPAACEQAELDCQNKAVQIVMIPIMLFLIACCCYFIWTVLGL